MGLILSIGKYIYTLFIIYVIPMYNIRGIKGDVSMLRYNFQFSDVDVAPSTTYYCFVLILFVYDMRVANFSSAKLFSMCVFFIYKWILYKFYQLGMSIVLTRLITSTKGSYHTVRDLNYGLLIFSTSFPFFQFYSIGWYMLILLR